MADTAIALPYLSSQYAIPETTLSTLTQAPTTDLVNQLLQSITKKAHEFDELKSDKLRLEVELENAVRSNESKVKVLKASVEKGHTDVEELRKKLHESGTYQITSRMKVGKYLTVDRKHPLSLGVRNFHTQILNHLQRDRVQLSQTTHFDP